MATGSALAGSESRVPSASASSGGSRRRVIGPAAGPILDTRGYSFQGRMPIRLRRERAGLVVGQGLQDQFARDVAEDWHCFPAFFDVIHIVGYSQFPAWRQVRNRIADDVLKGVLDLLEA